MQGSYNGWINAPPLVFQSKKTGDYHEDMNTIFRVFEKWFTETLLLSILPGSTILMDNAPYYSRIKNSASRKSEMIIMARVTWNAVRSRYAEA